MTEMQQAANPKELFLLPEMNWKTEKLQACQQILQISEAWCYEYTHGRDKALLFI
jgi:hypothetical protein